jgi:protein-disulfide isomerase
VTTRSEINLDRHVYGDPSARVTVVEYGDFECPYCAAAAPELRKLIDSSDGSIRLVFRHFPIFMIHPYALTAALAAEASGELFWDMHDLLLIHQSKLTDVHLRTYAARIGAGDVTGEAVQRFRPAVVADYTSGVELGVRGTPTLFIDGHAYQGRVSYQALRSAVRLPA